MRFYTQLSVDKYSLFYLGIIQKHMDNIFTIIHEEFGDEKFEISAPRYNICKTDGGICEFTLNFNTGQALKRAPELEELIDAKPHFEATAIVSLDFALEKGAIVAQNEGYDYDRDEHLSNIYYFEHNSVEQLCVKVEDVFETSVRLQVSGKAIVNGSNGMKPDADLLIDAVFEYDSDLEREVC